MALAQRIYKHTDKPMSWTKAILLGFFIYAASIVLLGQLPSVIIYKFDQYVAEIIEFTRGLPGVADAGLNTTQVRLVRDLVANAVQSGILVVMIVFAYVWQEKKRKRTGGKGLADPVKGYMSGK